MQKFAQIPIQTPTNPKSFTKNKAKGISTNHSPISVNILGINVSFAPLNAPTMIVDAANNGSDKSSILNIFTPNSCTAASGVNQPKMTGAKKYIAIAVIVTISTPHFTAD